MSSDVDEVRISRQHSQFVTYTELRQQRVNCSKLDTFLPALVAERRGRHVIFAIRHDQWDRRKSINDLLLSLGTGESLQQFLKNQPGRHQSLTGLQGADQCAHHWSVGRLIPPQH